MWGEEWKEKYRVNIGYMGQQDDMDFPLYF